MEEGYRVEHLLYAYRHGLFPMADSAEAGEIYWYNPPLRGQLSIEGLHIPSRLLKTVRQDPYEIRTDSDFTGVIDGCAEARKDRPQTWINETIRRLFIELHEQGHAHSVECYEHGKLVGGLYGMALGGAFFGESMFSRRRDASKVALVHLAARLWKGGYTLLDTQFVNDHLKQFGIYEIPREEYLAQLEEALVMGGDFVLEGMNENDILKSYLEFRHSISRHPREGGDPDMIPPSR